MRCTMSEQHRSFCMLTVHCTMYTLLSVVVRTTDRSRVSGTTLKPDIHKRNPGSGGLGNASLLVQCGLAKTFCGCINSFPSSKILILTIMRRWQSVPILSKISDNCSSRFLLSTLCSGVRSKLQFDTARTGRCNGRMC